MLLLFAQNANRYILAAHSTEKIENCIDQGRTFRQTKGIHLSIIMLLIIYLSSNKFSQYVEQRNQPL